MLLSFRNEICSLGRGNEGDKSSYYMAETPWKLTLFPQQPCRQALLSQMKLLRPQRFGDQPKVTQLESDRARSRGQGW